MGFVYRVLWVLNLVWIILSETINILRNLQKLKFGGCPEFYHIYIAPSSGLRRFEVQVVSDVWSENAALFERLMKIIWFKSKNTVEPLYNEVLGTMKITLLYQVSHYQCCIRGRLSRDEAETETWLSEPETQALRDRDETETWLSETAKDFFFFFFFFFHPLNLLLPFWGLYTVDSRYNKLFGPSEITLLYQNFVISGLQNNKIQRNFEPWDQENYFVISDFVISVFFITSPLYIPCRCLAQASGRDIET